MITITPAAAEQIQISAQKNGSPDTGLRLAARTDEDGTVHYGMGFDQKKPDDLTLNAGGVEVLIGENYREFFLGTTLDYVELNPGEFRFIFSNPNDPNHRTEIEKQ